MINYDENGVDLVRIQKSGELTLGASLKDFLMKAAETIQMDKDGDNISDVARLLAVAALAVHTSDKRQKYLKELSADSEYLSRILEQNGMKPVEPKDFFITPQTNVNS